MTQSVASQVIGIINSSCGDFLRCIQRRRHTLYFSMGLIQIQQALTAQNPLYRNPPEAGLQDTQNRHLGIVRRRKVHVPTFCHQRHPTLPDRHQPGNPEPGSRPHNEPGATAVTRAATNMNQLAIRNMGNAKRHGGKIVDHLEG